MLVRKSVLATAYRDPRAEPLSRWCKSRARLLSESSEQGSTKALFPLGRGCRFRDWPATGIAVRKASLLS